MKRELLFVDDKPRDLPSAEYQALLAELYGLTTVRADPSNPIESALQFVRDRPAIGAVLSDSCGRHDYSHITQLKRLRGDLLVGVLSGNTSDEKKRLALAAGADDYLAKGTPLKSQESFFSKAADDFFMADRRYWAELPKLLQDSQKAGRWVAYTRDGLFAEGDDDVSLVEQCAARFKPGQFVVGQVIPPFHTVDLNDRWVVHER